MSSNKSKDAFSEGTDSLVTQSSVTTVDQGDDLLLEKTIGKSLTNFPIGSSERETAILKSADILMQEGLPVESKRVLRKLLRENPTQVQAREKLRKILDEEVNQILKSANFDEKMLSHSDGTEDMVLESLEEALSTGLKSSSLSDGIPDNVVESFQRSLMPEISDLTAKEKIDICIGLIEMGFAATAQEVLEKTQRQVFLEEDASEEDFIGATYLLAQSLMAQDQATKAIGILERFLSDGEFRAEQKCEGAFLMGQAHEAISNWLEALGWYEVVETIDPNHRNIKQNILSMQMRLVKQRVLEQQ